MGTNDNEETKLFYSVHTKFHTYNTIQIQFASYQRCGDIFEYLKYQMQNTKYRLQFEHIEVAVGSVPFPGHFHRRQMFPVKWFVSSDFNSAQFNNRL